MHWLKYFLFTAQRPSMLCPAANIPICDILYNYLRNEFIFWKVHRIMNTLALVQSNSGFTLTLQETRGTHDSMNLPKTEFITYIYILYYQSSINFQFSPNLADFPDILN